MKHMKHNFHSAAWVMPEGWDFGVLGVKSLSVWICNGVPSTACSCLKFLTLVACQKKAQINRVDQNQTASEEGVLSGYSLFAILTSILVFPALIKTILF